MIVKTQTMTYTKINHDDRKEDHDYTDGICCVCLDTTSGTCQQFYNCSNLGVHYICNYCYSGWQEKHPNNKCPTCRSSPKIRLGLA